MADPTEGTTPSPEQSGEPEGHAGQPDSAPDPSGDIFARMRNDPDFAVSQYREIQADQTRKSQQLARWKALEPYHDQLGGGEGILGLLEQYAKVQANPQAKQFVDNFLSTGAVSTEASTNTSTQDEWGEPDPNAEQLNAMRAEIDRLKAQVSNTQGAVGSSHVTTMLGQLKEEFPDAYDEIIEPSISQQVDKWKVTPQGRETLATLNYEQLQNLAYIAMGPKLESLGEKRYMRGLQEKKSQSTDGGRAIITTGAEPRINEPRMSLHEKLTAFRRDQGDSV